MARKKLIPCKGSIQLYGPHWGQAGRHPHHCLTGCRQQRSQRRTKLHHLTVRPGSGGQGGSDGAPGGRPWTSLVQSRGGGQWGQTGVTLCYGDGAGNRTLCVLSYGLICFWLFKTRAAIILFVCCLGFVFRMLLIVNVCFMKRVLPGRWVAPCPPGTSSRRTTPQPPQHSQQSKMSPDSARCPPGAQPALLNALRQR